MDLFSGTIQKLQNSLDYSAARNNAISNNIANVDTPGYKAKDVAFKDVLKGELDSISAKRTDSRHFQFSNTELEGYRTFQKNGSMYNNNENNVDIDKEMTELAKNQIYYQTLVDRISGKFKSMQNVLRGGN
ncbi:flagellar basal body rod protein FlgB [Aciduricibacillus chroicocephali]|uniref:Flagellar basal body rod protein FlgB n=1 Tax=Aciduricibacillus chroicocephali TaxID=3054939 RepID=A0ABY9KYE5_9BACI|nr:flagellar basal body rod protein FlgB [Bacillaceae bacterium 44XB]